MDDPEQSGKYGASTGLNDYVNQQTHRNADERRNVARLSEKMRLHMAHLRDLIYARKAALALMQAADAEGAGDAVQRCRRGFR